MKKRLITLVVIIMAMFCLSSCMMPQQASGKLIYGVECIIVRCTGDTFYIIEKPDSNDEKEWEGLDLKLRKEWVKLEYGEVAGKILKNGMKDNEFLDAKVSMRVSDVSAPPCIDDLWDDAAVSPEDVQALGLFESRRCANVSDYVDHWENR